MEGKTAEQVYKNIQVLQGTPASQVIPGMHVIKAALGVDCEYCHRRDRASDDVSAKQVARQMFNMMKALNEGSFGGGQQVTCFTCHRGKPIPETTPSLPVPAIQPEVKTADAHLPSAEQVLSAYLKAIGGEQAIKSVHSRVVTATQDVLPPAGKAEPVTASVTFYSKAPNLKLVTYQLPDAVIAEGFDGKVAWEQNAKGVVTEPLQVDQGRLERYANFYESLNLASEYQSLMVEGKEKIGNNEAYVLTGYPANGSPENLYFDVQTGLLLRRSGVLPTPFGDNPFEFNYSDYRAVDGGVKIPFVIQLFPSTPRRELASHSTIKVIEAHDNVSLSDSKFAKPKDVHP
jgi:hypothetical protein